MYVCLLFSIIPIRIDLSTVCPLVNQVHFQWTFSELVDYNVIDACHGFRKWLNFEIDYCSSGNTRFRIRNFLFPYHISCAFRKLKQKTELSEKQKLDKKGWSLSIKCSQNRRYKFFSPNSCIVYVTDYGLFAAQIQIPLPNKYLGVGYKKA